MSNTIKQWLCGQRDYNVGVALYKCYGNDERFIKMLDQGVSSYRLDRLVTALSELEKNQEKKAPVAAAPVPEYHQVNFGKVQLPETKVPKQNDQYRDLWYKPYCEMNALRARLLDFSTEAERGNAAFKILELQRECESIWERRDFHLRTGKAMPVDDDPVLMTDPNRTLKQLNNVRSYITKARNILDKDPQNKKAAERLKKYETEREYLLQQLPGEKK